MAQLGQPVNPVLEQLKPFERREAESPLDQGEVDAIRRFHGKGGIGIGSEGRRWYLGHERTIARGEPVLRPRHLRPLAVD
jgi:hypothetical protein